MNKKLKHTSNAAQLRQWCARLDIDRQWEIRIELFVCIFLRSSHFALTCAKKGKQINTIVEAIIVDKTTSTSIAFWVNLLAFLNISHQHSNYNLCEKSCRETKKGFCRPMHLWYMCLLWGYWEQFVVTKMEFSACDTWMYVGFIRIQQPEMLSHSETEAWMYNVSEWVSLFMPLSGSPKPNINSFCVKQTEKYLHFCIEFGLFVFVCCFRKNPQKSFIVRIVYVWMRPKMRLLFMRSLKVKVNA